MAVVITAVIIMAVTGVAVIKAARVITPGKGSGENPEKSSLWKKGELPSGLLTQKGAQIKVIGAPINTLPAQKGQ